MVTTFIDKTITVLEVLLAGGFAAYVIVSAVVIFIKFLIHGNSND